MVTRYGLRRAFTYLQMGKNAIRPPDLKSAGNNDGSQGGAVWNDQWSFWGNSGYEIYHDGDSVAIGWCDLRE
jgi:hypothetical protein